MADRNDTGFHCGIALALAFAACTWPAAEAISEAPGPRFVQDRFAIGFFGDPPESEDLDKRFREIADAHFSVAIIGELERHDPAVLERKLALCDALGLKAIVVQLWVESESLADGPACWGYGIRDEPNTADFPALAQQIETLREVRPGKLGLINLFPSYASPSEQLGAANYEAYVAAFVDQVDVDVLCMDHYPRFLPHSGDGREAYCSDLAIMRKYALKKGIPFWNFFNAMPFGYHTDPTEAQLRWQVFASLSYGAKGVLYFCYWTPTFRGPEGAFEFPKGGAIITADGRRTRHYEQAQRINARLQALGPTLMQLTSIAVLRIGPQGEAAKILADSPLRALERAAEDPPHNYLIGIFRHQDGRRAVLIQNYHFAYTAWPSVAFDAHPQLVKEVDQRTGQEVAVADDSPEIDGLQLSLDAGEGRLFLLPRQSGGE